MAVIKLDGGFAAFPISYERGNPIPLDKSSVWYDETNLDKYVKNTKGDATAYIGQYLSLADTQNLSAIPYFISGSTTKTRILDERIIQSTTKLENDAVKAIETEGRIYPVEYDGSGNLAVNIPWTDTHVSSVYNHYKNDDNLGTSSSASSTGSNNFLTGVKINHDSAGHITGITVYEGAASTTDKFVEQNSLNTTTNANYPILTSPTNINSITTGASTTAGYYSSININPSTGTLNTTNLNVTGTTTLGSGDAGDTISIKGPINILNKDLNVYNSNSVNTNYLTLNITASNGNITTGGIVSAGKLNIDDKTTIDYGDITTSGAVSAGSLSIDSDATTIDGGNITTSGNIKMTNGSTTNNVQLQYDNNLGVLKFVFT